MLKLLHRYILREFIPPFGLGLLVFTFLLILNHIFLMMDLFLNRGVELWTVLKMAGFILPMFLPMSIPMAALLGTLLCYGRLAEDGELTAFRSAGFPLFEYSWPNLLLGLAFSLFLVQFNLDIAPRATQEFRNLHYAVARKNPLALFAPGVMNQFGDYKIIVEKMDRRKRKLTGVSIYLMSPEGAPTRILAPEGEVTSDPTGQGLLLHLVNGAVHQPSHSRESQYTITKFNRFSLRVPTQISTEPRSVTPRELTRSELNESIGRALLSGQSPVPFRTEKNLRIAIAFSPLVFIFLGIVLGVRLKRGSRSMSVGMSLVVLLCYYGLFIFTVSLASQGLAPALLLTWVPNGIAAAVGGGLWLRLSQQ